MSFRLVARGEGDCKKRYRPQRISEIVPTFPLKEARAILTNPNTSKVWLFGGLTGCGKTTLARVLCRALVCTCKDPAVEKPCLECDACVHMEHIPDFNEVNAAKFSGKDDTKKKVAGMHYVGNYFEGKKFYIFDEVHGLTAQAQELLLKIFEEPDDQTYVFCCTTHVKGIKRTLLGRCATMNFKRVDIDQTTEIVKQICEDTGTALPDSAMIERILHRADGSVREVLNAMDKVILGTLGEATQVVGAEHAGSPEMMAVVDAYVNKNWSKIREFLRTENVKNEPEGYRQTVCDFLCRRALGAHGMNLNVAGALGHLTGSLADEPQTEQYNIFVLRSMRACYQK